MAAIFCSKAALTLWVEMKGCFVEVLSEGPLQVIHSNILWKIRVKRDCIVEGKKWALKLRAMVNYCLVKIMEDQGFKSQNNL